MDAVRATAGHDTVARNSARKPSVMARLYPERRIAGFSRHEGRFLFYSLVAELLAKESVVLDLGAGRGAQIECARGYLRQLIDFSGRCRRYIGTDPDPVVLENPFLDEAHVMSPDGSIPLPDSSVDLIVAYAVLEHIADPRGIAAEIQRVLKPGGWFCAWTPNKRGYVGIAARIVPHRFHARIVQAAVPRGGRTERDVFPVLYRMNTKSAIHAAFDAQEFEHYSFYDNGPPTYHFNSMLLARFWLLLMTLMPIALAKSLFVFVRKRPEARRAA